MLPQHSLKVVLVEPEIPQNAGNVGRLCAAVGAELHLVRPLGFFLTDRHFKRAGMDYLKSIEMTLHDDLPSLMLKIGSDPIMLTSGLSGRSLWESRIAANTWIFMGKESTGLPADLLAAYPNSVWQIPMLSGTRGLNLATAVGVVVYEVLRQLNS
ncbi:MAG: tRNA (cytidine(34)-2'-O)-methyltransferase [Phycisphaerales bacterium]|nr:tRNA (cytidine(34)-2'-O)-methyltransferase [Phycisphaerales bacterium]